jgi:hypothetical protein
MFGSARAATNGGVAVDVLSIEPVVGLLIGAPVGLMVGLAAVSLGVGAGFVAVDVGDSVESGLTGSATTTVAVESGCPGVAFDCGVADFSVGVFETGVVCVCVASV